MAPRHTGNRHLWRAASLGALWVAPAAFRRALWPLCGRVGRFKPFPGQNVAQEVWANGPAQSGCSQPSTRASLYDRLFLHAGRTFPLLFWPTRSMNEGAMNLDNILFNKSIDQCRSIGRRGGLRSARNRRLRKAGEVPAVREVNPPHEETMAEARARIDALCPWLREVEIRTRRRP